MIAKTLAASAALFGACALAPAASAQTCDAYFSVSTGVSGILTPAFAAIRERDAAKQAAALPGLERELAKLQAAEVKPEVCGGNHINAYTLHQYTALNMLRARGINDFPADLPIVKQPDLNQASLAYAVGWIKYEKGDFAGALAAFDKGLAMFPHNADLANEKIATLMQLNRTQQVLDYVDAFISSAFILDDETRAKMFYARGVAQMTLNDLAGANSSLTISLNYHHTDDAKTTQDKVREALAKKN